MGSECPLIPGGSTNDPIRAPESAQDRSGLTRTDKPYQTARKKIARYSVNQMPKTVDKKVSTERQVAAFAKGRTPVKVALHYSDGSVVERLCHDPIVTIRFFERCIKEIQTNFVR